MSYASWKHLADDVIDGLFRGGNRTDMRNLFDLHRSVLGRAYGLKPTDAEEVGFHAVADRVRDEFKKEIVVGRDDHGVPVGWRVEPMLGL